MLFRAPSYSRPGVLSVLRATSAEGRDEGDVTPIPPDPSAGGYAAVSVPNERENMDGSSQISAATCPCLQHCLQKLIRQLFNKFVVISHKKVVLPQIEGMKPTRKLCKHTQSVYTG